jgi:hypothetical protein
MPTPCRRILRYTSLAMASVSMPLPTLDIGSSICRFDSQQTMTAIVLLPRFVVSSLTTKSIKMCRHSWSAT